MTGYSGIPRRVAGWEVREVASTGSTNTDLIDAVEAGQAGDRTALRSDHQTAGRGRRDRRWDAPPGANLLVSLLFADAPGTPNALVQRVAVAAVRAVEALSNTDLADRLGVKWPNDLLLDGNKLAGVLAQRSSSTGAVVVGIGMNVNWAPDDASSLADNLNLTATPAEMLDALLAQIDAIGDVAAAHRERLLTLGRDVRIELPGDQELKGRAIDVDATGRLIVDDGQTRHTIDVGDVIHLRT